MIIDQVKVNTTQSYNYHQVIYQKEPFDRRCALVRLFSRKHDYLQPRRRAPSRS